MWLTKQHCSITVEPNRGAVSSRDNQVVLTVDSDDVHDSVSISLTRAEFEAVVAAGRECLK